MIKEFFIQTFSLCWKIRGIEPAKLDPQIKKIENVIQKLKEKSKELHQPISFLISVYAHYYVTLYKIRTYNEIQLKLLQFLRESELHKCPKFSGDDIDVAHEVFEVWNRMWKLETRYLPFAIRSLMVKKGVHLGKKHKFEISTNFLGFYHIAKFINENRKFYPQIHGIEEFLIHYPIIRPTVTNLIVYAYFSPIETLEQYYAMVYKVEPKEKRLEKFKRLISTHMFGEQDSKIWGIAELRGR